jgi:recombination protein RecR
MEAADTLARIFQDFPGIGPRQAGRFVEHLLRQGPAARKRLLEALRDLYASATLCTRCYRFHSSNQKLCAYCADPSRDETLLTILASDADCTALERSGVFKGRYFILGGLISLASDSINHLRIEELRTLIAKETSLRELILAFPANPEGDATAMRVREEIGQMFPHPITMLGRGLSTGSELEYADGATLRAAFSSRTQKLLTRSRLS